jgi:hypothetical protein
LIKPRGCSAFCPDRMGMGRSEPSDLSYMARIISLLTLNRYTNLMKGYAGSNLNPSSTHQRSGRVLLPHCQRRRPRLTPRRLAMVERRDALIGTQFPCISGAKSNLGDGDLGKRILTQFPAVCSSGHGAQRTHGGVSTTTTNFKGSGHKPIAERGHRFNPR